MLPVALLCVGDNLVVKDFGASCQDVDLPIWVEMADDGNRGVGEVSTASKANLEDRLHLTLTFLRNK